MTHRFTTEQILFIQKKICKPRLKGGSAVDRRIKAYRRKKTFRVPNPEKVVKEIRARESRGMKVKAGFFDDLVCGKEEFMYA